MTIKLDDVKRLRLETGDVLAIRLQRHTTSAKWHTIRDRLQDWFPDNNVIILEPGADLVVIRPPEGTTLEVK